MKILSKVLKLFIVVSILTVVIYIQGCTSDDLNTSMDTDLRFSVDTLRFDTVFTEKGSATYSFKIYNDAEEPIQISNIELVNKTGFFRMNVDGISGDVQTDVRVEAQDSIYLFCEVNIDPDQPLSISPFVISDEISFKTNGNQQTVYLEAWGQNANYFPGRSNQGNIALLTCQNQDLFWSDEKPYVIYGVLAIDSCVLHWPEGTRIYVHGGVVNNSNGLYNDGLIFTLPGGRIISEGSLENPVIVQTDRLEPRFDDVRGQWSGIRLGQRSRANSFTHTIIKNGIVGIQADSQSQVVLNNVEIYHTAGSGIVAVHADVKMNNTLIYENGGNAVQYLYGGNFEANYCTLVSYGNNKSAFSANNFFCYDEDCSVFGVNPFNGKITNSIIVGNDRDELFLYDGTEEGQADFSYSFENCLLKINDIIEDDLAFLPSCNNCIEYDLSQLLFVNRDEYDFHLDSLSVAENQAKPISITIDKADKNRDPNTPDLGCYEY